MELVKRQDRYDLYGDDGVKMASSAKNPFGKLSKENCDEIFGVINVEKLAEKEYPNGIDGTGRSAEIYRRIYIEGFNKAMELNKDKLFTENDIARAFIQGVYTKDKIHYNKEEFIKSMQQPSEIEVEIEQTLVQSSIDGEAIWKYKLDDNGCLILTKKKS